MLSFLDATATARRGGGRQRRHFGPGPAYTACVTKRVLIVDDEPPVVEVLKDFFRQFRHAHSYETESARDAAEALIVLLRGQFDLILLDMHMPRMGRLWLLKQVPCL